MTEQPFQPDQWVRFDKGVPQRVDAVMQVDGEWAVKAGPTYLAASRCSRWMPKEDDQVIRVAGQHRFYATVSEIIGLHYITVDAGDGAESSVLLDKLEPTGHEQGLDGPGGQIGPVLGESSPDLSTFVIIHDETPELRHITDPDDNYGCFVRFVDAGDNLTDLHAAAVGHECGAGHHD